MRVVVSLTSIPGRADLLRRAIMSLRRQTHPIAAVYLWLPEERFGAIHPDYRFTGVKTSLGPDLGPAMKILPLLAVESDPDTVIVPVDDDVEYPPELIERLVTAGTLLPDQAIGFTGWNVVAGAAGAEILHLNEDVPSAAILQPVHVLEGYRGVLYRRGFFDQDIFRHLEALEAFRYHDDILLSGYLASRGITRTVRWYGTSRAPEGGYWTLNGQAIGLHTRPGWLEQGWACWHYWVRNFPGCMPPLATPERSRRLQLAADRCPREGFLHHRREEPIASPDLRHDLRVMPWPWRDSSLDEVLALDTFAGSMDEGADWLREGARILRPGGVLRIRLPIQPGGDHPGDPAPGWTLVPEDPRSLFRLSNLAAGAPGLASAPSLDWRVAWERDGKALVGTLLKAPATDQ